MNPQRGKRKGAADAEEGALAEEGADPAKQKKKKQKNTYDQQN